MNNNKSKNENKMDNFKISEDIIKEVENLIDINEEKSTETEGKIIFDGRQYTLKIPKKIADTIQINPQKDSFIFRVETFPIEQKKNPELTIIYKRGQNGNQGTQ